MVAMDLRVGRRDKGDGRGQDWEEARSPGFQPSALSIGSCQHLLVPIVKSQNMRPRAGWAMEA